MSETCTTVPAVPAVPAVPSSVAVDSNPGWNAGARSEDELDGNVYLQFDMPQVIGAVCGLASSHRSTDPVFIEFALLFASTSFPVFQVLESGVEKTAVIAYTVGDVFRIERYSGRVRYLHNGDEVYVSSQNSVGALITVGCLYTAGDTVGVEA